MTPSCECSSCSEGSSAPETLDYKRTIAYLGCEPGECWQYAGDLRHEADNAQQKVQLLEHRSKRLKELISYRLEESVKRADSPHAVQGNQAEEAVRQLKWVLSLLETK